ncbi:MAG: hypothetical protein IRY92_10660 [Dactylosporangium sp.]|nr:hypothetical protein [Dactylosporangium sp.]
MSVTAVPAVAVPFVALVVSSMWAAGPAPQVTSTVSEPTPATVACQRSTPAFVPPVKYQVATPLVRSAVPVAPSWMLR